MKQLLFMILLSSIYLNAITIKLSQETDTSDLDIDEIYLNYMSKNTHSSSITKFNTNKKNSSHFFIGANYTQNLSAKSILKNSKQELNSNYIVSPLSLSLGMAYKSADIYLSFLNATINSNRSYKSANAGFRYKMTFISEIFYPFVGFEGGYAMFSSKDINTTGMFIDTQAGLGLDISFLSLKVAYSNSMIFWDYPVEGITNKFSENSIKADASIQF